MSDSCYSSFNPDFISLSFLCFNFLSNPPSPPPLRLPISALIATPATSFAKSISPTSLFIHTYSDFFTPQQFLQ
ncbi:hypothetical protein L6452_14380 [Arctium lappa]|uniref:Uncharacterized protein n=1 Tax=Arctium lappa TaxID=4217 RepID=A0ACB9CL39_ARCLA|nr:hypothetical protein L6452_14380 [Arctium lappa]